MCDVLVFPNYEQTLLAWAIGVGPDWPVSGPGAANLRLGTGHHDNRVSQAQWAHISF